MILPFTYLWGETLDQAPVSIYLEKAKVRGLHQHPYWLKLLHFYSPGESIGQWNFESDVVTDGFFLSANGKNDPEAELKATLEAFFAAPSDDPNQHAQCKFVARFQWLKSELDFNELKQIQCPQYERWANLQEANGISIVFVSAYFDNPASAFGHLLLKFNSNNRYFAHSLLSPTLNFGAMVQPDDNPLEYVFRGLFGGYTGSFTDERFYNFNDVYGEKELRDLWEYPILFTKKERNRVTAHAWELMQNVGFKYFFFLDNCAYRMAELLELAWTNTTRINTSWAFWAIPVDVIFKTQKKGHHLQDNETELTFPSLLGKPQLIPSRQRKLKQRVSLLDKQEIESLGKFVISNEHLNSPEFNRLTQHSQAKTLDAYLDYLQYKKTQSLTEKQIKDRNEILLKRSKLPVLENEIPKILPKPPNLGSPPMRFSMGLVANSTLGNALEMGTWANYHDLLGDESGHLENAEIVTLDLNIQFRESTFNVTKFKLYSIQKLALNPTGIPGDYEWSWRTHGGWERKNLECFNCPKFSISGGFGQSISIISTDVEYVFVDFFAETKTDLFAGTSLGYAPHLGFSWNPVESWKMRIETGWFQYLTGSEKKFQRTRFDQRWTLSQFWDTRFVVEQWGALEAKMILNLYW